MDRPKVDKIEITQDEFQRVRPQMETLKSALSDNPARKLSDRDNQLIKGAVLLANYRFESPEMLKDITRAVREHHPRNPFAYFRRVFAAKLEKMGCDIYDEMESITVMDGEKCDLSA
tara:strand:+ start:68 stop:418 length:351 start_codon:yes stop_codon:yes gene_type:complete